MHKKVLDHGYVRLISHMGDDLDIVRAARHSYDAAWRAGKDKGSDDRLINYLISNYHTTPFESVEFQFSIRMPIFVARQFMRHRTFTFNELSGRYRELPELFYVPEPDVVGTQSSNNKQVREINQEDIQILADRTAQVWEYEASCRADFKLYHRLLEAGWPREIARIKLPLSTYTDVFAKCDLHNLFHFLTLRLHPHAQYEIRAYAETIGELIEPIVPVAVAAWKKRETYKLDIREMVRRLDDGDDNYSEEDMVRDFRAFVGTV